MTENATPWERFWRAVDSEGHRTRWTATIAGITLAACFTGYLRHSQYWWSLAREYAAALRTEGIHIHFGGPGVIWEWLVLTLICVLYGAWGWRRLGGVFVCAQIVVLLPVCTAYLDYVPDSISANPWRSWPGAAQGGCITGLLASLGVAWMHRRTPSRPQTLRAMFVAMVFAAVMLGGMKLWVEWSNADHLAIWREHGPW